MVRLESAVRRFLLEGFRRVLVPCLFLVASLWLSLCDDRGILCLVWEIGKEQAELGTALRNGTNGAN